MKKICIIFTALFMVICIAAMGYSEVLYETDFEDGDLNDWGIFDPGRYNWIIVDGTLQNSDTPAQYITLQAISLPDTFVVQFDTRTLVDGGEYCVLSFYIPWANHYRPGNFEVWNNGMRLADIGYCVDYKQTPAMSGANPSDWHHFKIIREEDRYAVYYDGNLIHEGDTYCTSDNRNFGFASCAGSTTQFDNLLITTLSPSGEGG